MATYGGQFTLTENQKLRKEIETVEDNEHPQPVAININVVDARLRSDEDDLSDA